MWMQHYIARHLSDPLILVDQLGFADDGFVRDHLSDIAIDDQGTLHLPIQTGTFVPPVFPSTRTSQLKNTWISSTYTTSSDLLKVQLNSTWDIGILGASKTLWSLNGRWILAIYPQKIQRFFNIFHTPDFETLTRTNPPLMDQWYKKYCTAINNVDPICKCLYPTYGYDANICLQDMGIPTRTLPPSQLQGLAKLCPCMNPRCIDLFSKYAPTNGVISQLKSTCPTTQIICNTIIGLGGNSAIYNGTNIQQTCGIDSQETQEPPPPTPPTASGTSSDNTWVFIITGIVILGVGVGVFKFVIPSIK